MSDSAATPQTATDRHPIGLIVTDDLERNRLTVFFRLLLAIPQAVWIALWGVVASVCVLIPWVATLFAGRVPAGLHAFISRFLRASTHLSAYVFLLADPWPPFGGAQGTYPVDVRIDPPAAQGRLTVLFRILLAVPAMLLTYVFRAVNQLVALLGWFYCLFVGRMHPGMRDLSAWLLRSEVQTYAYLLLLTGRYPSLAGSATA